VLGQRVERHVVQLRSHAGAPRARVEVEGEQLTDALGAIAVPAVADGGETDDRSAGIATATKVCCPAFASSRVSSARNREAVQQGLREEPGVGRSPGRDMDLGYGRRLFQQHQAYLARPTYVAVGTPSHPADQASSSGRRDPCPGDRC